MAQASHSLSQAPRVAISGALVNCRNGRVGHLQYVTPRVRQPGTLATGSRCLETAYFVEVNVFHEGLLVGRGKRP